MKALAQKPRPSGEVLPSRIVRDSSAIWGLAHARLIQRHPVGLPARADPLESEADRIAEQVCEGTVASSWSSRTGEGRSSAGASGEPLDAATRAFMEARFGHDFRRVRIHRDAAAAESARSLGARAFTVGQTISFDAGRYEPASPTGRKLLAHELAHTLQQGGARALSHGDFPRVTSTAPRIQRDAAPDVKAPEAPETKPASSDPLEALLRRFSTPEDCRLLTPDELKVAMDAEKDRRSVLTSAIDRLDRLTRLLAANGAELRPMARETSQGIRMVSRYLRTYASGWIGPGRLEFDWANDAGNRRYIQSAIRAHDLMIANSGSQLPKVHYKPGGPCDSARGLYAKAESGFVKFCPNFFGTGPDQPAVCPGWTLTHEYFHPLGVLHGEGPGSTRVLPRGPEQALQNANALTSLAFELAGRDLAACNAYDAAEVAEIVDLNYERQQRGR